MSPQAASDAAVPGVLGNTVLLVTAADLKSQGIREGWLGRVTESLLGEARVKGCHTMVVHPSRLDADLGRLVAAHPLGIVLIGANASRELMARLEEVRLPLVLYGDEFEAHGHDMITPDHVQGTADLTRWLIERGARRILRLWPHRSNTPERPIWLGHRDRGYEQTAAEAGLPVLPAIEYRRTEPGNAQDDRFEHRVREVAGRLVEHMVGPDSIDAILLPSDSHVPEVAAACRLFGRIPNKDVLIAGYDNDWEYAPYRDREPTRPMVTTEHDTLHLGQSLLQTLLQRAKDPASPPQRIALPPRIIEVGVVPKSANPMETNPIVEDSK